MKVQEPGFENSPRHVLMKAASWHLLMKIGESALQSIVRPLLPDPQPVSALQLAMHGDFVSMLVPDGAAGVAMSTVGIGQSGPQPFGKIVAHDDLPVAKRRSEQLGRSLNTSTSFPYKVVFKGEIVPNDASGEGHGSGETESEVGGQTERSFDDWTSVPPVPVDPMV